jgi:F420-non-reducing hydrogenase small subunit
MNQKIRLNTEWLSVCGGCHVAIVDLHEKLIAILKELEIQRCPVLTDVKDYPEADLGIITGSVRNEHDREAALKMRGSCKTIIAFGTCALYGGISGAGTVYSPEALLNAAFLKNPTTKRNVVPETIVSPLEKIVTPLDDVIEVDLYLPGCPPHASFIADALLSLLQGRPPKARDETCCAKCNRKMKRTEVDTVRRLSDGVPEDGICFLSQGYICLGSVTLDRCLAPCPNEGTVCTGCAGPSRQILSEPNRDIRTEVADRMSFLTKIPYDVVVQEIERASKSHYSYAMATRMIGQKPTFLIKKWISQMENDL